MFIYSSRYNKNVFALLPSVAEVSMSTLFLIAWLFPIISCWLVSFAGLRFSYVAQNWQASNLDVVGISILLSLFSGLLVAVLVLISVGYTLNFYNFEVAESRLCRTQKMFILTIACLSGVGLYKSFGGMVFQKSYSGPSFVWLGYGAWSVTYVFALIILFGDLLNRGWDIWKLIVLVSLGYIPMILCGSRIDYLSTMAALSIYILYTSINLINGIFKSLAILAISIALSYFVGDLRYKNFKNLEPFNTSELGMEQKQIETSETSSEKKSGGSVGNVDMFYLSTIGDVGASYFQVVGLVNNKKFTPVGFEDILKNYFGRLLPGPFFKDRPVDISGQLPEAIAGGTLHALGEGYLIGRYVGVVFVSSMFGAIVAISILCARRLKNSWSPTFFVLFLFPWLLLIRGGWYQFFSIFKSLEILFILSAGLVIVKFLKLHCLGKNFWGRMC